MSNTRGEIDRDKVRDKARDKERKKAREREKKQERHRNNHTVFERDKKRTREYDQNKTGYEWKNPSPQQLLLPNFEGNHANEYFDFYYHALMNRHAYNPAMLGNISNSDEYYFQSTNDVVAIACSFMAAFWSEEENYLATINAHVDKIQQIADVKRRPLQAEFASCISFMLLNKANEPGQFCAIAVSSIDKLSKASPELVERLKVFARSYTEKHLEQRIVYRLVQGNLHNYNELLVGLARVDNNNNVNKKAEDECKRNCAEKSYGSVLLKLLIERGEKITVEGVANFRLYPYSMPDEEFIPPFYTSPKWLKGPHEANQLYELALHIKDQQQLHKLCLEEIPCCGFCNKIKSLNVNLFVSAQNYIPKAVIESEQRKNVLAFSGIYNSIGANEYESLSGLFKLGLLANVGAEPETLPTPPIPPLTDSSTLPSVIDFSVFSQPPTVPEVEAEYDPFNPLGFTSSVFTL